MLSPVEANGPTDGCDTALNTAEPATRCPYIYTPQFDFSPMELLGTMRGAFFCV